MKPAPATISSRRARRSCSGCWLTSAPIRAAARAASLVPLIPSPVLQERRARLAGAMVHALRRLASLVDPFLRHLDGVGVSVPFGGVHHAWRRGYMMLVNITAVADAHERLRMPEGALQLVRLPFDLPAPVLDVFSHI